MGSEGPCSSHCRERALLGDAQHTAELPQPSTFSLSSGSHPHPELSPLQTSCFQGHSTALWEHFFASQNQAWVPAPKCCLSASPRCGSPAWLPGLASLQLWGHREGRQALAVAQGGSHSQEGARGNREHRLPFLSLQTQLDVHPSAEGSAWGRRQELLQTGREGGPGAGTPCSSGTGRQSG